MKSSGPSSGVCRTCRKASFSNFLIFEWQVCFHRYPMFKEIVAFDGPMVGEPGVGVEINEEGMRKYAPLESRDGRTLYYLRGAGRRELLARPTAGGEERTILPCGQVFGWAVTPGGIFHLECGTSAAAASWLPILRYWDAATGQDRVVATLEVPAIVGLGVSPDGRSILYGGSRGASDLMMIENFR